MTDSGSENINSDVNSLISENLIVLTIAQIDVDFSNSMVEALFRRMKHGFLFFKTLSSEKLLKEHTNFYVEQSNMVVPHSSLKGGTPFEVFTGKWNLESIETLKEQYQISIQKRMETNRSSSCQLCPS